MTKRTAAAWQNWHGTFRRFATLTAAALTIGHVEREAPQTELVAQCSPGEFVAGAYQDTFAEYFGPIELAVALDIATQLIESSSR